MDIEIREIGENKGKARVWLQGEMLNRASFTPQVRFSITRRNRSVVLVKDPLGYRNVCAKKKNEQEIPVIDLNSDKVLGAFAGLDHVRITYRENEIEIEPLASEIRAKERRERTESRIAAGEPLKIGSLAHGGGIMCHAIKAGLTAAGVKSELAFANEVRNELIEHAMAVNPVWTKDTIALNGPMQELAFDEQIMRELPQVDLLEIGIPCSGASVAGMAKRGLSRPEAHPEVGHLLVAFLAFVARTNPTAINLECVVGYFNAASMDIIRSQLRDMQYEIHEQEVNGEDWNALEHRKRKVMVAVTKGMAFDFADLERPAKVTRTLAEILEPIALDDPRWSTMQGLKDKEIRDKEAGKSFAMQIFDATSTKICTLTKGLQKGRSTDAKIRHPENPDLLRIPTQIEHARSKDIPEVLIAGASATLANEMLGQSVIYTIFVSIGKLIGKCFKALAAPRQIFTGLPLFDAVAA